MQMFFLIGTVSKMSDVVHEPLVIVYDSMQWQQDSKYDIKFNFRCNFNVRAFALHAGGWNCLNLSCDRPVVKTWCEN